MSLVVLEFEKAHLIVIARGSAQALERNILDGVVWILAHVDFCMRVSCSSCVALPVVKGVLLQPDVKRISTVLRLSRCFIDSFVG